MQDGARGAEIDRQSLAEQARVSANTVVRFENERHEANEVTLHAIRQAFEAAGVTFTDDGGIVPPEKRGLRTTQGESTV